MRPPQKPERRFDVVHLRGKFGDGAKPVADACDGKSFLGQARERHVFLRALAPGTAVNPNDQLGFSERFGLREIQIQLERVFADGSELDVFLSWVSCDSKKRKQGEDPAGGNQFGCRGEIFICEVRSESYPNHTFDLEPSGKRPI